MATPHLAKTSIARLTAVCTAIAVDANVLSAQAQQDGPDFKGRTVSVIISFEAGGPYDLYGRLFARFLSAHLKGNPQVVPQNMPGAGGLNGANHLYNVAARDGTAMGLVSQTVAVGQLLGTTPGIRYDAARFVWLGRINSNTETMYTSQASGVDTIDRAKSREVIVAGTGPTSSSVVFPRLMNELAGTKFKVVSGFRGPASAQLAFESGEVQASVRPWSAIKATMQDQLRVGKINLLVQFTLARHAELAQVPAVVDLGETEAKRQILGLFASGSVLGTSVAAPPGLAADVASALRRAFGATLADPALRAEAKKSAMDVDPMPGEQLQEIVSKTFLLDSKVVEQGRAFVR